MKSMWIIDRLLSSREFKNIPPGSLYDRCVREMNRVEHNPLFLLRDNRL
jgi:hypothetical protein